MSQNSNHRGRRNFILGLSTASIATSFTISKNKDFWINSNQNEKPNSLKQLADDKRILYGSNVQDGYKKFFADPEFRSLFIKECALLIAGFQWTRIYSNAERLNFSTTDPLVKFATDNQMLFRGQPLIYHQFQPQWLIDKFQNSNTNSDEIREIFVSSISSIVSRYVGKVHSWVVVNEAINIGDGRTDGLRDTTISNVLSNNGWGKYPTWHNFIGSDYIDLAFQTAAKADPQAILIYNENRLCYDIPEQEGQRLAVLNLLKYLKSKNTPIHALGIQSHLNAGYNKFFNPQKFSNFLKDVANLGFKIIISELDVNDRDLPADIEIRDHLVAEAYSDFLAVALNEPAVISITTWGLSDRYSWLSWISPRQDKLPVRPLPYDEQLEPKPAWKAIANAFQNAPNR